MAIRKRKRKAPRSKVAMARAAIDYLLEAEEALSRAMEYTQEIVWDIEDDENEETTDLGIDLGYLTSDIEDVRDGQVDELADRLREILKDRL